MERGRQPVVLKAQEEPWHKHIPRSGSQGSHVTLDGMGSRQLVKEVLQSGRWKLRRKLAAQR